MKLKQLAVAMLIGLACAATDDKTTKPAEGDKKPTDDTTKPDDSTTKPTDGETKPTDDTTKPTDDSTKPKVDPENDDIDTTITYDLSDECARCIKGGYVYCF